MKVTYDKEADAAYIYLKENIENATGWVSKTYSCDPKEINGMINLDFDADGHLGGIEIMDASKKLSKEILDTAVDT
jgi:uncharacterized protein YuzE